MFNSRAYEELCLRIIHRRRYDPDGAEEVSTELCLLSNAIMSFVCVMGELMPRLLRNYCLSEEHLAHHDAFCFLEDSRRVQSESDMAERRAAEAVNRLNEIALANRLEYVFYYNDANDLRRSYIEMAMYMVDEVVSRWSAPEDPIYRGRSVLAAWSKV